ncbi:MAG TPA: phosphoserine phosphatase SerB [Burkholderiales bacterium]|nr:phosphoserine phosphatase SerB [Burkholderiales bacterium]
MNLVIQGPALARADVDALASELNAKSVQQKGTAFVLKEPSVRKSLDAWSESHKADHAWIEQPRRFADLKLLAMDMDSTLITIECIDELGDLAGKRAEVAGITARAMRGEIDYPQSLRERVALLAGLPVAALEKVYQERLRLTAGAQALIAACKRHQVKVLLVSGGFTFFVERLRERLGLDYTISNVLEIERNKLTGKVTGEIVGAEAKAAKFLSVMKELKATRDRAVAIGDGANDLKMMKEAGISIAFHAKPVVRAQAAYALNWSGLDAVLHLFP